MIEHLFYACVLILIQAWILPAAFNTKNVKWMLSNRDENPDTTLYYDRSKKAFANLQESVPVFFMLGLLAIYLGTDLSMLMKYWIIFRIIHVISYVVGISILRSISFIASVIVLFMMAGALI